MPRTVPLNYIRLYKNHGPTIGYWEGWVELPGTVVMQYAKSMDGQAVRQVYEAEGKNVGRANETSPATQAALELDSRARKKLDKGYVESLSAASAPATNTLGLERPMLATPLQDVKPENISWAKAYVQPKLDGHRCLFKDGLLYSREGKIIEMPHILRAVAESGLSHLHLDGELYLHGKSLQEISRLVKKMRPESLDLEYHIFDVVLPQVFIKRLDILHELTTSPAGKSLLPMKHLTVVKTYQVYAMQEVLDLHQAFRVAGYEGTMLRFGDEPYRDGKRSRTLLKIKEFQDAEFKVISVKEGKPYIRGRNTFRVPIWVCDVGNGSTMDVTCHGTMEEKNDYWEERSYYIGRKLTVKFHYLSEEGIPQLPVALRFHETI